MNKKTDIFSICELRKVTGKNVIIDFKSNSYYQVNDTFVSMWYILKHDGDERELTTWLINQGVSDSEARQMVNIFWKQLSAII